MSRKNIITGTLILTCANLITKCMGFFYRVFMSNAIGAEGMGLYQLILPLYMLAWSITSAGFTTTISHLAAQEYIRGQNGNIGRIVKQAVCLSLCASVAVSCVLFFGADSIALSMLRDRRAAFSLRLLALAAVYGSKLLLSRLLPRHTGNPRPCLFAGAGANRPYSDDLFSGRHFCPAWAQLCLRCRRLRHPVRGAAFLRLYRLELFPL